MSIQFSCNACKKRFKADEKYAGKTVACPGCKKPVKIPSDQPAAEIPSTKLPTETEKTSNQVPQQDVDSLVASALEDPKQEAVAVTTIEFQCPFCEENLSVGMDLGGKQTPCSSCRRIVKVPMPEKKSGPDWKQQGPKRPLGAMRPQEPELEGTWNSSMDNVSRESLLEAGAIVQKKIPLTISQKITRAAIVVFTILFVVFGYRWFRETRSQSALGSQMLVIENGIKSGDLANLNGEARAILLGDLAMLKNLYIKEAAPAKGKKGLQSAMAALDSKTGSRIDKDLALRELSKQIIFLGGNKEEEKEGKKIKWDEVQKFLKQPLDGFSLSELKLLALQDSCSYFISRGESARAVAFLSQVMSGANPGGEKRYDEASEAEAFLALELLKAQKTEEARPIVERIRARYSQGGNLPLSPASATLFTLVEKEKPLPFNLPKAPTNEQELACLVAVELAKDGLDAALDAPTFKNVEPIAKIRVLGRISLIAATQNKVSSKLGENLKIILDEALMPTPDIVHVYVLLGAISSRLGVGSDSWQKAAERVPTNYPEAKSVKGLLQYAGLMATKDGAFTVEDSLKIEPSTLSHLLAIRSVGTAAKGPVPSLEQAIAKLSNPDRAFGFLGLSIGLVPKALK